MRVVKFNSKLNINYILVLIIWGSVNTNLILGDSCSCRSCPAEKNSTDRGYVNDLLLEAIDRGDTAQLTTLLNKYQLNVDDNDHTYIPILQHVIAVGRQQTNDMLKLLLQAGAAVNQPDMLGRTALMAVADSQRKNAGQAAQLLISHGAKIDLVDRAGETALQIAQKTGNQAVIAVIQTAMTAE